MEIRIVSSNPTKITAAGLAESAVLGAAAGAGAYKLKGFMAKPMAGAVADGFFKNKVKDIGGFFSGIKTKVAGAFSMDSLRNKVKDLGGFFSGIKTKVAGAFSMDFLKNKIKDAGNFFSKIKTGLGEKYKGVKTAVQQTIKTGKFKNVLNAAKDKLKNVKADKFTKLLKSPYLKYAAIGAGIAVLGYVAVKQVLKHIINRQDYNTDNN